MIYFCFATEWIMVGHFYQWQEQGVKNRISFGEDKQDCGYVETEVPMEYTTALEHSSFVYNGLEHGRSVFLWQMKSRKEKKIRQGVEREKLQ